MVLPVLISLMGEISIEIPSLDTITKSKATAADKAESKIIDTIKNNKNSYYREVYRKNGYVAIGKSLDYEQALARVLSGNDVFTYNGAFAYWLARAASGGKIPVGPEIDKGKVGTVGYYWHYHTYEEMEHMFFICIKIKE